MTESVPEDWDDLVETLRSDLETVSTGEPGDEEVRTAIDEVWGIVDAAEDRVGSVDPEAIGEAFGVDTGRDGGAIEVESIPREFVSDDPARAAGLSRLVSLIGLDGATDYDVGRLWDGEREGNDGTGDDETSLSGEGEEGSSPEGDGEAQSTDEGESDRSASDAGEELRSHLGDALSQFRDRIQDAREGIEGPTDGGGETGASEAEHGADDSGHETDGEARSTRGRSTTSNRSSTAMSTMPSNRRDVGSVPHFSTMPGRRGRSGTSQRTTSGEDRDDRSGSDGAE